MEAAMARLLQAQAQQVQSMAALQGTFDRLAENLTPRAPHASPTALLTKQPPGDYVEAFLEVFERTAEREGWPEDRWAHILAPFLTGDAERAYQDLGTREATDYPTVKGAILAHYGHNLALPRPAGPRLGVRPPGSRAEPGGAPGEAYPQLVGDRGGSSCHRPFCYGPLHPGPASRGQAMGSPEPPSVGGRAD
ncbi:uncharacterized protein ACO6RY_19157 [Pungitius sinensis]